jgi:hypothetical protein
MKLEETVLLDGGIRFTCYEDRKPMIVCSGDIGQSSPIRPQMLLVDDDSYMRRSFMREMPVHAIRAPEPEPTSEYIWDEHASGPTGHPKRNKKKLKIQKASRRRNR